MIRAPDWTCDCCGRTEPRDSATGDHGARLCPWCEHVLCARCIAIHEVRGVVCTRIAVPGSSYPPTE